MDAHVLVALLSAIFIFVTCKQCSVDGVQYHSGYEACRSSPGNFDNITGMLDGRNDGSALVSRHSVELHSHQDICPLSRSFCLASTLTGLLIDNIAAESEAVDASDVQSKGFSFDQGYGNSSLFNPHDEAHHVEEVTAWTLASSGNTSSSSISICFVHSVEDSNDRIVLSAKAWLAVEVGEAFQMELGTNLTGVEWLSLGEFGVSISLALLQVNGSMKSLEFQFDLMACLKLSSLDSSESLEGKTFSCYQSWTEEVNATNMGDLRQEVVQIKVWGVGCGLYGLTIHSSEGFRPQPGESARLCVSCRSDSSGATRGRDLLLVLASGRIVIPPKVNTMLWLLHFLEGSLFWLWFKKSAVGILLASSLLIFLLFAASSQNIRSWMLKFVSSLISTLKSLCAHVHWRNGVGMSPPRSQEAAALVEQLSRHHKDPAPDQGPVNQSSACQKQAKSSEPETNSVSNEMSGPLSTNSFDPPDPSDALNLSVQVRKEKRRRKRRKKSSSTGTLLLPEASSCSRSSNSSPSSPLSPVASNGPKPAFPAPPGAAQEYGNPLSISCSSQFKSKCAEAQEPGLINDNVAVPPACHAPNDPRPRAPRAKLIASTKTTGVEQHEHPPVEINVNVVDPYMYAYDMWADHLFGQPLTLKSKSKAPASSNGSDSFFVWGPLTFVATSRQIMPVIPVSDGDG